MKISLPGIFTKIKSVWIGKLEIGRKFKNEWLGTYILNFNFNFNFN
jgi:hypothetical protein